MNNIESKRLKSKTNFGNLGKVKMDKSFTKLFFGGDISLQQEITNFSKDGTVNAELCLISSLNNLYKMIFIKPRIKFNGYGDSENRFWGIYIDISKYKDKYIFRGMIGGYADAREHYITPDTFNMLAIKTLEMCNPDVDYSLDGIIGVLRSAGAEDSFLQEWVQVWDRFIGGSQEHQGKKPLTHRNQQSAQTQQ